MMGLLASRGELPGHHRRLSWTRGGLLQSWWRLLKSWWRLESPELRLPRPGQVLLPLVGPGLGLRARRSWEAALSRGQRSGGCRRLTALEP